MVMSPNCSVQVVYGVVLTSSYERQISSLHNEGYAESEDAKNTLQHGLSSKFTHEFPSLVQFFASNSQTDALVIGAVSSQKDLSLCEEKHGGFLRVNQIPHPGDEVETLRKFLKIHDISATPDWIIITQSNN